MSAEEGKGRSYLMELLIVIMSLMALVLAFWDSIVVEIPAGHKGVLFRNLGEGTVLDRAWGGEGSAAVAVEYDECVRQPGDRR